MSDRCSPVHGEVDREWSCLIVGGNAMRFTSLDAGTRPETRHRTKSGHPMRGSRRLVPRSRDLSVTGVLLISMGRDRYLAGGLPNCANVTDTGPGPSTPGSVDGG